MVVMAGESVAEGETPSHLQVGHLKIRGTPLRPPTGSPPFPFFVITIFIRAITRAVYPGFLIILAHQLSAL